MKKRYLLLSVAVAGIIVGWLTIGGTAAVLHATSTDDFCISCHSMESKAYTEYLGSPHFTNQRGIRAGCADCHIPNDPIGFLKAKIIASKDLYHHFITKKISTPEKYEAHREAMAETVWATMRKQNSQTCLSCHSYDAMEIYDQTPETVSMHEYGREQGQACIDCHKGVAHLPPKLELDSSAFDHLFALAENTPESTDEVYSIDYIEIEGVGRISPAVELEVISAQDSERRLKLSGYQVKGAESVLYIDKGQRAIIATLTEETTSQLETGEFSTDEYGNEWRRAALTFDTEAPLLASNEPLWEYAEQLDTVYCSTCHAKIPAGHFTLNAWGPVAKSMGDRTDISALNLEILTKYLQNHAKDFKGPDAADEAEAMQGKLESVQDELEQAQTGVSHG